MTVTVGYTTDDALSAYAIARGYVLSGDSAVNLQLALDWLELQPFIGEKTDPLQTLEWPRDGDTVVPDKIVQAQLEAALVYMKGGDLTASIGKNVIEKTVGPLTTKYAESGPQSIMYPKLSMLLRGYVSNGYGSTQFKVSRA